MFSLVGILPNRIIQPIAEHSEYPVERLGNFLMLFSQNLMWLFKILLCLASLLSLLCYTLAYVFVCFQVFFLFMASSKFECLTYDFLWSCSILS
jgi:hypothetical protein